MRRSNPERNRLIIEKLKKGDLGIDIAKLFNITPAMVSKIKKKYVDKKQLFLEYRDPFEITDIVSPLIEQIKTLKIKRIVVDSTSLFGLYFKEPFEVRKQLYKLITALKAAETTTLLTAEILEDVKGLSRFGVEEFIADGIILLHYMGIGKGTYYSLQIRKMRRTNHGKDIYPMMITDKGIKVGKALI